MKNKQLHFNSRKDLEERIYVNYTTNAVFIYKSKKEKMDGKTIPYMTMTIKEFKRFFKV